MADAKTNAAWRDARREILLALNLPAEYQALGLRLAHNARPNARGWIAAHCFGEEDNDPSAGICVADGPTIGFYRDFRSATRSCNFFDFCAIARGGQYPEIIRHFAQKTGVKLPSGDEERTVDRLEFRLGHYAKAELGFGEKRQFAEGKAGVTVRAIDDLGCRAAAWPRGLSAEHQNQLLVVPMYGSSILLEHEPTGWHCAAVHPARKIRQYQGKGHEERLLKTMTLGEYGLMNVDGLKRLAEATVVNIVEGLTDLLATQAALIAARELNPQYDKHVVLSTGGAQCGPKPEWLQHFAGKDVRVWGDVGDKDNAGQIGAMRWCSALHPVAQAVRNVVLPLGKDDGKNDVRAWLTEEDRPRGYVQLDEYARKSQVLEPEDKEVQLSPHGALLETLGIVVLGEHEGTQRVEIYCKDTRKTSTIQNIDYLTMPGLVQYAGLARVEEHIHEGREPQPGKFQIKDVKNAIAAAASMQTFSPADRLGGGVWEVDGEFAIVRAREARILKNGTLELVTDPFWRGKFIDMSAAAGDWCDFALLQRYLNEAKSDEWCGAVFRQGCEICSKWYWKQKAAPQVITSLMIASWIQTYWTWRPEVFVTGGSDTGKSLFVEKLLPALFGNLAWQGDKPTEAAVRQHLRHHAKIAIMDEMEQSPHRNSVFELWRVASQGGTVSRGTADQKGITFRMCHLPWFAAIETGLKKQADKNRFIFLELQPIPPAVRGTLQLPSDQQIAELGQQLLAVGLHHAHRAKELANQLKVGIYKDVPGRVLECFAVPCAIAAAIEGLSLEAAKILIESWLTQWDFTEQASKDESEVLDSIMASLVRVDHGGMRSVSQLLTGIGDYPDPDVSAALANVGLKLVTRKDGRRVLFIHPNTVQRHLMKDSEFAGHSLSEYLKRLPGADRDNQRLGCRVVKGISVPRELIDDHHCGENPQ